MTSTADAGGKNGLEVVEIPCIHLTLKGYIVTLLQRKKPLLIDINMRNIKSPELVKKGL